MNEIPEFVKEALPPLMTGSGKAREELIKEYQEIFSSQELEAMGIEKEEEKQHIAFSLLWGRYMVGRAPTKRTKVVVVGIDGVRKLKSGRLQSSLFGLMQGSSDINRVVMFDKMAELQSTDLLFKNFDIDLCQFSGTAGDFYIDERASTQLNDGKSLSLTSEELLLDKLKLNPVSINNITPSKITTTGYVQNTDWRAVEGVVVRTNKIIREDGTKLGIMDVIDESLSTDRAKYKKLTVWINPDLITFDADSVVYLFGSVSIGKEGDIFMNAYSVIPKYVKEVD
jgi:hypothetical protein